MQRSCTYRLFKLELALLALCYLLESNSDNQNIVLLSISNLMRTAELIFQLAGLKSTASRLMVTALLIKSNYPLTHQDLLKQLPENFDRVTLYRVLDWLLQNNIVHRVAGEDRTWRFQLNGSNTDSIQYNAINSVSAASNLMNSHAHAHFQCDECGKIFCLDNVQPKLSHGMPENFIVDSIELNIKGKCSNCYL